MEDTTKERIDYGTVAPAAVRALLGVESYVDRCGLEPSLLELVRLRASQMNGCGYCVDMHSKNARIEGETEQRAYALPVWRETPFFSERERAALAWTEALTVLPPGGIDEALYRAVRGHFSEKEIVDLTVAVAAINGWNRLAAAFKRTAGTYQPPGWRTVESRPGRNTDP